NVGLLAASDTSIKVGLPTADPTIRVALFEGQSNETLTNVTMGLGEVAGTSSADIITGANTLVINGSITTTAIAGTKPARIDGQIEFSTTSHTITVNDTSVGSDLIISAG